MSHAINRTNHCSGPRSSDLCGQPQAPLIAAPALTALHHRTARKQLIIHQCHSTGHLHLLDWSNDLPLDSSSFPSSFHLSHSTSSDFFLWPSTLYPPSCGFVHRCSWLTEESRVVPRHWSSHGPLLNPSLSSGSDYGWWLLCTDLYCMTVVASDP